MTTTRGQHLIGKEIGSCVLERLLGYGGSSAVFLARSLLSGEVVAVKVFLPRSTLDGQMRKSFYQRFLREAEAASELEHPNILSIYAYGEHEGMPYIVMPYMVGGTLAEYLQRNGPLALEEARSYLEQVAAALDYAHTHGCVHCDVKPGNLLLDEAGNVALSDFGIVHLLNVVNEAQAPGKAIAKTGSETLMGTPDYVSPEQALGEPLDGRSDVYSLAATLYDLLTGNPPFRAETPIALALMHVHEAATPVGLLRADVTPQIDFVISKALAKWPEERFQTAGAFAMAFTLAVKEAESAGRISLKQVGVLTRPPVSPQLAQSPGAPVMDAPSVQIRPVSRPRTHSWRAGLLVSLTALLLVGCLFTALFINTIMFNSSHTAHSSTITPSLDHGPFDALADDQQNWPQSSTFFFQHRAYIIQNTASLGGPAMAFYANHMPANFHLQVTIAEVVGSFNSADYYGVAFRASADQSHYYLFDVSAWNSGQYGFLRYDGDNHWTTLDYGQAPGFLPLAGQQNILSVDARNDTFTLFINGQQLGKPIHDRSSKARLNGELGLVVEEQKTQVAFSRLSISPL